MADGRFDQVTDEELVTRARAGDAEAEELLYGRYKNTVRIKARPYFLVGADREDLLQEGMIGLYKAIRDYSPDHGAAFRSFAEMCVTRQIITAVKRATRRKHGPLNSYISIYRPAGGGDMDKPLLDVITGMRADDPADTFISNESYAAMRRELDDMLSGFEKQVMELFLTGLSYQDIAQRLGRDTKAVDNALQRVKKKLEKYVESAR